MSRQMADILTKANFTADAWNSLLRLAQVGPSLAQPQHKESKQQDSSITDVDSSAVADFSYLTDNVSLGEPPEPKRSVPSGVLSLYGP